MRNKTIMLLLFSYFQLISFASGEMIVNPVPSNLAFNPVNSIIIFDSNVVTINLIEGESLELNVIKDFTEFYGAYLIKTSILLVKVESNYYVGAIDNIYYRYINDDLEGLIYNNQFSSKSFGSDVPYSDSISLKTASGSGGNSVGARCAIGEDESIFYGKKDDKIYFYCPRDSEDQKYSVTFGDIDDQVSCRLLSGAINVCAFTNDGQVKLKILIKIYKVKDSTKEVSDQYTQDVSGFNHHRNAMLYDTSNESYKILCAVNTENNNIECLAVYIYAKYVILQDP